MPAESTFEPETAYGTSTACQLYLLSGLNPVKRNVNVPSSSRVTQTVAPRVLAFAEQLRVAVGAAAPAEAAPTSTATTIATTADAERVTVFYRHAVRGA